MTKSPFLVFQDFIPPLLCEKIIDLTGFNTPTMDKDDNPVKTSKRDLDVEQILFTKFEPLIPVIEQHYQVAYKGTEPIQVDWFPEQSEGTAVCDSSSFLRRKWVRTKDRDFTALVFLSDYQDTTPFDDEFEVYGGKMEFPQWGFGFNPQRGTMVVYPSGPHFINKTSKILIGDLYQAKIHVATQQPFLFNAVNFPGTYMDWFKDTA